MRAAALVIVARYPAELLPSLRATIAREIREMAGVSRQAAYVAVGRIIDGKPPRKGGRPKAAMRNGSA